MLKMMTVLSKENYNIHSGHQRDAQNSHNYPPINKYLKNEKVTSLLHESQITESK